MNGKSFKKVFKINPGYYKIKVKAKLVNGVELNQVKDVRFIGADISKCKDSVDL